MSHDARTTTVRKTILETLSFAHGYALAESTLRSQVNVLIRPPLSDDEWQITLNWMQLRKLVTAIAADLDETLMQFALTEQGRVALATL